MTSPIERSILCLRLAVLLALPLLASGITPPPHSGWQIVPSASDLIDNAYWNLLYQTSDSSVTVANGTLTAVAGQTNYLSGINIYAPQLEVNGNFGITATVNVSAGGAAWLELAGSLTTGPSYWNNQKYIAIGLNKGFVGVYWSDGSSPNISGDQGWAAGPFSGTINIELLRVGNQFTVSANGILLGQVADIGIFSSGNAYLGINVAPETQFAISGWAAEVPQGQGNNVQVILPAGPVNVTRSSESLGTLWARLGRYFGVNPFPAEVAGSATSVYSTGGVFPTGAAALTFRQTIFGDWNALMDSWFNFSSSEPEQGRYNLGPAMFLADFAANNGMPLLTEALIQNSPQNNAQLPTWLTNGQFNRDRLLAIMQDHIQTEMSPFIGRVAMWDVVQEAFDGQGNVVTDSPWINIIGFPDCIDIAFQMAHQIDPNAKLVYNEWGAENAGPQADAVYNLVKGMLSRGVPIDGVTFEGHFSIDGANFRLPIVSQVEANMKRFADLGLFVGVSEMDVEIREPASQHDLQTQAQAFSDMATACIASFNCISFSVWDLDDANSWINMTFPGFGSATLFDENFQPKPAYFALRSTLEQAVASAPQLSATAVTNAASYANQAVAPGEIVALFANNVGTPSLVSSALSGSGNIATDVGGTRVLFDGIPAPMIYTVSGQVSAIVPYEVSPGSSTQVQLEYNGIPSAPVSVPVSAAVPGIFATNGQGTGQAAAVNQDGTLNSASNPAARNSIVVLYATGEGQRNPPGVDGVLAPANEAPVLPVSLTVGGLPATAVYAASAPGFAGLMQINVQIPSGVSPGPAVPVVLTVGTQQSNAVTIGVD